MILKVWAMASHKLNDTFFGESQKSYICPLLFFRSFGISELTLIRDFIKQCAIFSLHVLESSHVMWYVKKPSVEQLRIYALF